MSLTDFELKSLRYDLTELAQIEYPDMLDELLDHYAALTEQKMNEDFTFDNASRWAWHELGGSEHLQTIQTNYVKSINGWIRAQHLVALKSLFKGPATLSTGLTGLLAFIVLQVIPVRWVIISLAFISLSPAFFLLWGYICGFQNHEGRGKIVWKYMCRQGLLSANFVQLSLNLPTLFLADAVQSTRTFLQTYPAFSITVGLATLLYTGSFIQFFLNQYKYKLA